MRKVFFWVVAGAAVWYLYNRYSQAKTQATPKVFFVTPPPAGAVMTGQTQTTTNNRPPGYPDETVGFALRKWAEVALPDGSRQWFEIKGA